MEEQSTQKAVEEILSVHRNEEGQAKLVPILISVQQRLGYLPKDAIEQVAGALGMSSGQIYSVASFYTFFKLKPIGRQHITICRGTACHIKGSPQVFDEISKAIGLGEGETSADMEYTLETVACIGCCALAPAMKINETVHGNLNPRSVKSVVVPAKKSSKA